MKETQDMLAGYTDREKGAYLAAIASIATADRSASDDELEHIQALAAAADLSPEGTRSILASAKETSPEGLKDSLDILKTSKLRFSLVADIITFAKIDKNYTKEEQENIMKMANYLQVEENQFSLLDEFVSKATEGDKEPEQVRNPAFLESLGLKDKFEKAGINIGSLSKGLLGMLGPMILSKMMSRSKGKYGGQSMGQNQIPIPSGRGFGGLGSIFSMLNKSGSYKKIGGLLPKIFG